MTADHINGCLSPLSTLAAVANATTTLRLGTMVLNNDLHPPSLLARDAASLDILSDGRFELGLGAGYAKTEHERAGISLAALLVFPLGFLRSFAYDGGGGLRLDRCE